MIEFKTEVERLKAREQFIRVSIVVYEDSHVAPNLTEMYGQDFDRAFPPIAPPKMVPFELWAVFNDKNEWCAWQWSPERPTVGYPGYHVYRVRVVEVDDE